MACFVGFDPFKSHRKQMARIAVLCLATAGAVAFYGVRLVA